MKISDRIEFLQTSSIKPDRNQPRKSFDAKAIEDMAQTILTQGIIAPIEIDENNVIITGELRWRASQKAKVPTIPCRRIHEISKDERLERQLIENIHRQGLNFTERDEKIYELYVSGRYGKPHQGQGIEGEGAITKLASALGLTRQTISNIIEAVEFRARTSSVPDEATTTIIAETRGLPDETRVKLLKKVVDKEIVQRPGQTEIREAVKIVQEAPEPIKKRFLTGELPLENMMPTRVRACVEKKKRARASEELAKLESILDIDFSDFIDEEELRRLEKALAETRPSELMY